MEHRAPRPINFFAFLQGSGSSLHSGYHRHGALVEFQLHISPNTWWLQRLQPGQFRRPGRPVMTPGHACQFRMHRQPPQATPAPLRRRSQPARGAMETAVAADVGQADRSRTLRV